MLWPRGVDAGPGLGDSCGVHVLSSALVLGPGPEVWASPGYEPPGWCWHCLALFPQLWKGHLLGVSGRVEGTGQAWRILDWEAAGVLLAAGVSRPGAVCDPPSLTVVQLGCLALLRQTL